MEEDLKQAVQMLSSGGYTCVLYRSGTAFTDTRRGIRPLLELLESGQNLHGFSAADRVVGKAAAFLYCLLGVCAVHAGVISTPALQVLTAHGIAVSYEAMVPAIKNRTQDGFCPMETAVWELTNPHDAPDAIRAALKKL